MVALVQRPAPTFKAEAVAEGQFVEVNLAEYIGQWYVNFFLPFTEVNVLTRTRYLTGWFYFSTLCKCSKQTWCAESADSCHLSLRDFTFVCPTYVFFVDPYMFLQLNIYVFSEILAFNDSLARFKELNTAVFGILLVIVPQPFLFLHNSSRRLNRLQVLPFCLGNANPQGGRSRT